MPELPEVETMRRGVLAISGAEIAELRRPPCALRPIAFTPAFPTLRRRVQGKQVTDVQRRGKRLVLPLQDGQHLVFEPRMTGLLLIEAPPDPAHVRLQIEFRQAGIPQLQFWDRRGLGTVQLFAPGEIDRYLNSQRLGPDALEISPGQLRDTLGSRRRPIKVALLDQKLLAGVGNLYAAEILHVARIHPETLCCDLSHGRWRRLHAAMQDVLEEAIRYEGSTLADGTYRNALNNPGSYQNMHRVYGRAGEKCRTCRRGTVRRIVQAQRATFYCPRCQTRRSPATAAERRTRKN